MDALELFNCEDNKYVDLYEKILAQQGLSNVEPEQACSMEKAIVTTINTRLERTATYCQGLNLLFKFLPKISRENLTKYFPHWVAKLTQILTNANIHSQELTAACRTIAVLCITCKQVAELDKRVSMYNIKQIVGIIVERYCQEKNGALLNLLTVLLYHYPESCARLQVSFSKIISSCVDDEKVHLVTSGAKCYALLVRAKERSFVPTLKDGSITLPDNNNANCHIFHQMSLCNDLCSILDELFQNLITVPSQLHHQFQSSIRDNVLDLLNISRHSLLEYYTSIENRFTNLSIYLSTLLRVGGAAGKKFVLPNVILQTINKGLMITPANLQKNEENKKAMLLVTLPKLYIALLNILEALIVSFRQELLVYADTVQRLILQSLECTQNFPDESFSNVRILTYKLLSIWLRQTQSLSGFQLTADEFLSHILKDLSSPNKNALILTSKGHKKSSKSNVTSDKYQEVRNVTNSTNNIDSNTDNNGNSILYVQILSTVQSIISNVHCHLKQSFYDSIRNTVVLLLYQHYVKKNSISGSKINAECRLQLLRLVRILLRCAHFSTPSPTSYAIQIFGIALSQDNNSEIVEEANSGLAEFRHILYPTTPTLMPPLFKTPTTCSSRSSSTQLSNHIDISQVESNKKHLNDEPDNEMESVKRPRFSAEYIHTQKTVSSINVIEESTTQSTVDNEMSFSDIISSKALIEIFS